MPVDPDPGNKDLVLRETARFSDTSADPCPDESIPDYTKLSQQRLRNYPFKLHICVYLCEVAHNESPSKGQETEDSSQTD